MERDKLAELVFEADPGIRDNVETFWTACALVGAEVVGCNAKAVSELSGAPLSFLKGIEPRLRDQGLWTDEGPDISEYLDDENGTTALWMGVCVAQGKINREWDAAKKEWMYGLSEQGKADIERKLSGQQP